MKWQVSHATWSVSIVMQYFTYVHRLSICLVSFFYSSINFTRVLFNQPFSLLSSNSLSLSRSRAHSRWRFDGNEERTCAAERQKETVGDGGRETWSRVKWTPVPTGAQQERRRVGRVDKTGGPHRRDSRDRELALRAHGARAREPLIHEFSLRRLRRVSGACRRMRSRATEGCSYVIRAPDWLANSIESHPVWSANWSSP